MIPGPTFLHSLIINKSQLKVCGLFFHVWYLLVRHFLRIYFAIEVKLIDIYFFPRRLLLFLFHRTITQRKLVSASFSHVTRLSPLSWSSLELFTWKSVVSNQQPLSSLGESSFTHLWFVSDISRIFSPLSVINFKNRIPWDLRWLKYWFLKTKIFYNYYFYE